MKVKYTQARTAQPPNPRPWMTAPFIALSLADCTYYLRGGRHLPLSTFECIVIYGTYTVIALGILLGIIMRVLSRWYPQVATADLLGWLKRWLRGE